MLTVDFGEGTNKEGFWEKGQFEKRYPGVENPWKGADVSAPYNQKFYIVMNVAVGGVSGFFPDGVVSWAIGKAWAGVEVGAMGRRKRYHYCVIGCSLACCFGLTCLSGLMGSFVHAALFTCFFSCMSLPFSFGLPCS